MRLYFLFLISFSVTFFNSVFGQDYTQCWIRTSVQHKLSSKFYSSLELHHRSQSSLNTESPFRYPLTNALRLWLIYKLSDHETINLSPYAFFSNHPQIRKEQDVSNSNSNEHRIHLQYENKLRTGKGLSLNSRFGGEYRIFEGSKDLFRLRFREALSYSITEKINIQIYDELFLNTMNVDKKHLFDQNRIGVVSNYVLSDKLKMELGVTHIQSMPRNGIIIMNNLMFQTNWIYSL